MHLAIGCKLITEIVKHVPSLGHWIWQKNGEKQSLSHCSVMVLSCSNPQNGNVPRFSEHPAMWVSTVRAYITRVLEGARPRGLHSR